MKGWDHYFPFATGEKFHVDGPLTYNGEGLAVLRSDRELRLTFHLPAVDLLNLPECGGTIHVVFQGDGPVNRLRVEIDAGPYAGTFLETGNAIVQSNEVRRRRLVHLGDDQYGQGLLTWKSPDRASLVLTWEGNDYDFDLLRSRQDAADGLAGMLRRFAGR
jgi:hypothetical protein